MPYDPDRHHRRSIRLRGYDYTLAGAYFVTICAQQRVCLFGAEADPTVLTPAGRMVGEWWTALAQRFPTVALDASVIMPNHVHGIVILREPQAPRLAPIAVEEDDPTAPSLSRVVQWFKTMSTNAYLRGVKQEGWPPCPGRLWQRDYYERIIRNDRELDALRAYIDANPAHWADDAEHPAR
jgi:REP element-mobilizing transposase RayT